MELHWIVKKGMDDKPIFIEYCRTINKYRKYKTETGKYSQIKGPELKNILELVNYFQTGCLYENGCMVVMLGTGTQFLEDFNTKNTKLPKGEMMVYKLNRFH